MTVLTKPSIVIRKADAMRDPLVLGPTGEEKININNPAPIVYGLPRKSIMSHMLFLLYTSIAIMIFMASLTCGLMVYKQYHKSPAVRYQGFCNVPIDIKEFYEGNLQDSADSESIEIPEPRPTHEDGWGTLEWFEDPQFDALGSSLAKFSLQEEFDIGETMEKIKVKNNQKTITYIHDFDNNITGILDPERCFVMPLDNDSLLSPDVFVISIENKDAFDLSLVRNTLYAALPALSQMLDNKLFGDTCDDKPVYQLKKQSKAVIRKRSPELPPPTYVHFAGKGIQEVEISNINELLAYEKKRA